MRSSPATFGHSLAFNKRRNITNIDNKCFVLYNPVFLCLFGAHINVEYCSSIKFIKYVCLYINKVSIQATFSLTCREDVSNHSLEDI